MGTGGGNAPKPRGHGRRFQVGVKNHGVQRCTFRRSLCRGWTSLDPALYAGGETHAEVSVFSLGPVAEGRRGHQFISPSPGGKPRAGCVDPSGGDWQIGFFGARNDQMGLP
jgi:hypothetical protein